MNYGIFRAIDHNLRYYRFRETELSNFEVYSLWHAPLMFSWGNFLNLDLLFDEDSIKTLYIFENQQGNHARYSFIALNIWINNILDFATYKFNLGSCSKLIFHKDLGGSPNDLTLLNVKSRIITESYVPRAKTRWLALHVKQTHFYINHIYFNL